MITVNRNLKNVSYYTPSIRSESADVVKLDWNECNLKFDENYLTILKNSLMDVNFSEYPKICNTQLIDRLSEYCGVAPQNVQIFNGSDSALHYIFACFLNPDSKVLVYTPNYTQIESYINLYSDNLNYSKITDIFDKHMYIFNNIDDNDIIYISNPNNPTGYLLDPNIIESLLQRYPDKLFVIDEAYYEFAQESCCPYTIAYDNIIVCRTFSKAFSLASIRLGYVCAHPSILSEVNKIRNSKEVNSFAQTLAITALSNIQYVQNRVHNILENREFFISGLKDMNIEHVDSSANFVLVRVPNCTQLIKNLESKNILIRDRSMLDNLKDCARITIGEMSDMQIILEEIRKITSDENR